ncbi:MAG: hypothetical protein ACI85K_001757 [Hyphomicrobiaceae bacterium]|jgi:hypothetical protein
MNRPIAWLAIIALLLAAGWYLLRIDDPAPTPTAPGTISPPSGTVSAGADTAAVAATIRSTAAPVDETPDTGKTVSAPANTFEVLGRCVLAKDGSVLADCSVQIRTEADANSLRAPWTDADLAMSYSDTAGAFELATSHDDWTDAIAVRIAKPGYVSRVARWQQPATGTKVDLGDVPMLRAIKVTGTVVDQSGAGVEDAGILFAFMQLTGKHTAATESYLRTRSDAAGRFSFDVPAHPGEWFIGAEDTGALIEPRSVKLTDETSFTLRIVVERPDPTHNITGTVVNSAGRPLSGMQLSARGEGFMGRGRTGDDGRFTVQRAGPNPDNGKSGTLLSVIDPDAKYERVNPELDTRTSWGKDGVQISMHKRTGRTVRVIDTEGQAVEAYTLFTFHGSQRLGIDKSKTQRGHHQDGRCRLTSLPTGPHAVIVMPRSDEFASTAAVAFEVEALVAANELLVMLPKPVPTSVHIVDASGKAMANSSVELLQSLHGQPPTALSETVALRDCDRMLGSPEHLVLATATTDASGTAHFQAPPGSWHVRVTGTLHVPQIQAVQVGAPTTNVQVSVQAAAIVFGQVQPKAALEQLRDISNVGKQPVVVIIKPDGGKALPPVAIDEEGNFTRGGLPTGLYRVSLRYWLHTGSVREDTVTLAISEVNVQAGQRSKVTVDATALLPGTVQGRIIVGGKPLRDLHCFLRRKGPGTMMMLRIATDSDGRFTGVVPAGEYGFSMTYPAQPGPGWLVMVLPEKWQLAPNQTHTIDFDVPLRSIRLRLLDKLNKPHTDLRVQVAQEGYHSPGILKTDATGVVEIFPAPLQAFHVNVTIDGKKQRLGPFDLPAGATNGTIVGHSN